MFNLSIITAEKSVYEGSVEMLVLPTVNGEIGILTNHHPLVAKVEAGALKLVKEDKTEQQLFISGGYLEFSNNQATVLADLVENIEEIRTEQAATARKKAEESLKNAKNKVEIEQYMKELKIQLMRERLANIAKYRKEKF